MVVVVVVIAPGRPLAARLILGPGRKGLTALPPIRALVLTVVLDASEDSSSVSLGGDVVVRVLVLVLKVGLGRRDGRDAGAELFEVCSASSVGAAVVRVRVRDAPNLLRLPMLG